ncbi:MAG: dihydroorotate dehydrogenase [Candidatus Cloacimonadota bacterium]|nr:dihydroorotate dehydrogenase [Candidatus Cloacimonadota bacterium]
MKIQIGKMQWKNPVTVASGTFGMEYNNIFDLSRLGALVTKTITFETKIGNETPRLAETEAGMLNSIGIQNPGVEGFRKDVLPEYEKFNTNLIVSISGGTIEEFGKLVERLNNETSIDAFEVNVSCPNVENEGIAFGTDPDIVSELMAFLRAKTSKDLILKLTPNVTSIEEIALAAEKNGADAISLINTVYGLAIDIETRTSKIKKGIAGYSGCGIKPIALQNVYRVAQTVKIPIIGMGGICNENDALEFIIAGASAVSVGTQNFVNPKISIEIIAGIEKYLMRKKRKYAELIGSMEL